MTFRPQPVLASAVALVAVLGSARAAFAGECSIDDDCGHGFECQVLMSGSGSASGGAGGTGGGGFAPPREATCGDGLCQTPETATTCVIDCTDSTCVLAECETSADCADGYACEDEPLPGTGGASAGPTCGDGICTGGETQETCAVDCTATRRCTPAGGFCSSDANCAPGFYCSFLGSGAGGTSASGSTGAGGFAGTLATGGAPGTSGSSSGGTTGGTGAGDAALPAGTCMPRDDGAGGAIGTGGSVGSGGAGTGGVGTGGTSISGSGGAGTSGTGIGGAGAVGAGGLNATGGTAGTDGGGTAGDSGGSPPGNGTGGTRTATGGTGGTRTSTGGTGADQDRGSAEHGGCSVTTPRPRAPLAELALLLVVGLTIARRRP